MLNPSSHQSDIKFMHLVHILNIGRHIHTFLIDNVIDSNLLLNMITVGKVSMNRNFPKNKVMPLFHRTLQLQCLYAAGCQFEF